MQVMVPNMDLCCELQKLPELFDHYDDHKEFEGDSFWEFLAEDYLNDKGDAQGHHDDSDHENLPFRGQHQCCHGYVFIPSLSDHVKVAARYFCTQTKASSYTFSISTGYLDAPFQPPKA